MIHYRTDSRITLLCGSKEEFAKEVEECCTKEPAVHVYSPDASLSGLMTLPNCFLTRSSDASKRLLFLAEGHVFLDYSSLCAPSRIRMRNILVCGTSAKSCKILVNKSTLLGLLEYYDHLIVKEAKDLRSIRFYR